MRISDWSSDVCSSDLLADSGRDVVLPLHPRTRARLVETGILLPDRVRAIDPVGYLEMLWLEDRCATVVTDSGGVQKEAYFHGKRCVTVRDETEWVELVALGVNAVVGVDRARQIGRAECRERVCKYVYVSVGAGN